MSEQTTPPGISSESPGKNSFDEAHPLPYSAYPKAKDVAHHGLQPLPASLPLVDFARAKPYRSSRYTTLLRTRGRIILGEPKTKKSRRTLHLTGPVSRALKEHLERQLKDMERLGDLYRDQGLVFTTEVATPINASNLRKLSFAPLLQKASLPRLGFHDPRHTCATLLLSKNIYPKYLQELLEHATVSITPDTYSHVLPGMGNQVAEAMEDVLT